MNDGAPADIWTLEQAPTGYLWLGTGMGLYRFDGVRFDRYPLREGQRLPSSNINALKVLPNGDIWLGFFAGGAARLRDGRATVFGPHEGMPPGRVLRFAATPDGVLWAAAASGPPCTRRGNGMPWAGTGATTAVPRNMSTSIGAACSGSARHAGWSSSVRGSDGSMTRERRSPEMPCSRRTPMAGCG
ncbi:hypothetical protein ACN28S_21025 [Cystobacter fuscus]